MAKRKGLSGGVIAIGALALLLGAGLISGQLSIGQDSQKGPKGIAQGKSATVSLAVMEQNGDSSSQVATTAYAWRVSDEGETYLGSSSTSSSSRTDYTSFVTGSTAKVIAFGSTYDYGKVVTQAVDTEQELLNAPTWKGVSSSNVATTFYNDGGSTTSVNLGADEQVALDRLKVKANNNGVAYNPHVVAFDKAASTNISSINMPNAEKVAVPSHLADSYDVAFKVSKFGATTGKPALMAYDSASTDTIEIQADSDGTNGETLTAAMLDKAPFIGSGDKVMWEVNNDADSPSDVGVGTVTTTFTLN